MANPADPLSSQPFGGGPIMSPAMFQDVLDEALYDARRLADANPGMWVYPSLIGILDGLAQMTVGGRRPSPEDRQTLESVVPSIRAQADHADPALLQRIDILWAYFIEWPAVQPDVIVEEEIRDADQPLIGGLDEIIVAAHRLRAELRRARTRLKEQREMGSLLAQGAYDLLLAATAEIKQCTAEIDYWAENGMMPDGHGVSSTADVPSIRRIALYAPEQVGRITQFRRSLAAWRQRGGAESVVVSSFEQLVPALHQSIREASALAEIAPDHSAIRKLADGLKSILSHVREWISDLKLPDDRDNAIAATLAEDLDLLDWPPFPRVQKNVRMLAEMVQVWTKEALNYFRQNVYETAIDLDVLRTVSATSGLDAIAWNVQQLVYLTANGKEPAPYERNEVRLDDAIKRELSVYGSPILPAFLARVRAIDGFWRRWNPPTAKAGRLASGLAPPRSFSPLSRHEAEETALRVIHASTSGYELPSAHDADQGSGSFDPIANAKSFTPEYFRHILDSSIRDISKLPMKFPFCRGLALQLRAIRLATDGKHLPSAPEQAIIGRGFVGLSKIIPGIEGAGNNAILNDAWAAHLYFQLLTGGESGNEQSATPAGMIVDPAHFVATLEDLIADVNCLLVLFPNHNAWLNVHRQLHRLFQRAQYGRELDASELQEIEQALGVMESPPADIFANVPAFAQTLIDRVRQTFEYSRGRRAASREGFEELLRAVLEQTIPILTGRNWDDDVDRLAAIDRQLRTMRRWTAVGRSPTSEERAATRDVLTIVDKLHGLDRMTEWAARVKELSQAFHDDLPANDGKPIAAPKEIGSIEEFGLILDETLRDCRSFGGGGKRLFHKATVAEQIWADVATKLAVVRRMLDQDRVPTQRERDDIHRATSGIAPVTESPCPAIHDFLADITGRLNRIDGYYKWLVTAGKYAGQEVKPIEATGVHCVTLGGEMRVAFSRWGGADPGIYICMAEKVSKRETCGGIEIDVMRYLPNTRNLLQLVATPDWTPTEIKWNAHSDFIAYLIPGNAPSVGWCETRKAGKKGRVSAAAFAWATKGSSLICLDAQGRSIFRVNAETGERKEVAALPADLDPGVTPGLLISPGGNSLVYTWARAGGIDLSFVEFAGAKPVTRVRKQFAGAKDVLPFWSDGGELGCLVISGTGGRIISLPYTNGDGEVLYESPTPMASIAPAWSSNGKFVAFFQMLGPGEERLALLDCDTREVIPLSLTGIGRGRLSFGEETVTIEGLDAAAILWLHVSFNRAVVERF